jgi:hypothetical protein
MVLRLTLAVGLLAVAVLLTPAGCSSSSTSTPGSCTVIKASSYDQSCVTDTDCAMVSEGSFCYRECQPCPYAVISVGATAKYEHDVAAALSGDQSSVSCGAARPRRLPPAVSRASATRTTSVKRRTPALRRSFAREHASAVRTTCPPWSTAAASRGAACQTTPASMPRGARDSFGPRHTLGPPDRLRLPAMKRPVQ